MTVAADSSRPWWENFRLGRPTSPEAAGTSRYVVIYDDLSVRFTNNTPDFSPRGSRGPSVRAILNLERNTAQLSNHGVEVGLFEAVMDVLYGAVRVHRSEMQNEQVYGRGADGNIYHFPNSTFAERARKQGVCSSWREPGSTSMRAAEWFDKDFYRPMGEGVKKALVGLAGETTLNDKKYDTKPQPNNQEKTVKQSVTNLKFAIKDGLKEAAIDASAKKMLNMAADAFIEHGHPEVGDFLKSPAGQPLATFALAAAAMLGAEAAGIENDIVQEIAETAARGGVRQGATTLGGVIADIMAGGLGELTDLQAKLEALTGQGTVLETVEEEETVPAASEVVP